MTGNLTVASSPHIRGKKTSRTIMLDVVAALVPAIAASVVLFGFGALLRIVVSVLSCVVFEYGWCAVMKKPNTVSDISAVITGILLAFNVPSELPVWQLVFGGFVAIVVVKQLFGGIGCNFVNPALAARAVMGLSFPGTMTSYTHPVSAPAGMDALTGGTPLMQLDAISKATPGALRFVDKYADLWSLFIGNHGGMLGETSAAALIVGGVYLILRGVIKPIIPLSFLGTALLFQTILGAAAPVPAMLSGGLVLGAVFMATDYVTSPYTNWGKLVFGVGCGLITATIRTFAASSEGVTYAILIMNLLVPYINDLTRRKPYGGVAK